MICEDLFQEVQSVATASYVKNTGVASAPVGFDPAILVTIFTTLLSLCKKSGQALKDACGAPTLAQQFVVQNTTRRELRDRYGWGAYLKFNGDAIVKTVFEVGSSADPAKIDAVAQAAM